MTTVILNQPDEPQDVPGVVIPVPETGDAVIKNTLFFPDAYQPPLGHEYQLRLNTAEGRLAFQRMLAFLSAQQAPQAKIATD